MGTLSQDCRRIEKLHSLSKHSSDIAIVEFHQKRESTNLIALKKVIDRFCITLERQRKNNFVIILTHLGL